MYVYIYMYIYICIYIYIYIYIYISYIHSPVCVYCRTPNTNTDQRETQNIRRAAWREKNAKPTPHLRCLESNIKNTMNI